MSTVTLTKWGNSTGVRIPAVILKEANLSPGAQFEIFAEKNGSLTLKPKKNEQEGWTDKFNIIADAKDEELLLDMKNNFDDEEWTW